VTTTEKETRTRAEAREDGRAATLRLQQLCELLLRPMPAPSDAAATELERR
jgi:hypothetical protein